MDDTILLYISVYGPLALITLLAIGFIGVPLPEQTLLTFTGFLVVQGGINYFIAILSASLGTILGITISFFIGHYLGIPFLEKFGYLLGLNKQRLAKIEHWYNKYGKLILTFGFFVPGLRHFISYFAGISKWSYTTFALYAIPGAVVWTTFFISIGAILGENWQAFLTMLEQYLWIAVVISIVAAALIWLYRRSKLIKKT